MPASNCDLPTTRSRSALPTVDIVMAAYNADAFLEEAICSVLQQSYSNFRLYIVDDGSTDSTPDIINRLSRQATNIVALRQPNSGQAQAKNRGAFAGSSDFIAFIDADDKWTTDKLEKQMPLFEDNSVGVTFSNVVFIDESGKPLHQQRPAFSRLGGTMTNRLFRENLLPFSSTIIRRNLFRQLNGFDENLKMGIDWDLWLRSSLFCNFDCVNDRTLLYRVWPGQMSTNGDGRFTGTMLIMNKFLTDNKGVIAPKLVRTAYAETLVNRAYTLFFNERDTQRALMYLLKSLRYRPISVHTLRIFAHIVLNKPWS